MSKENLLMIGNYLPPPKYNLNVWHDLANRLAANGWTIITTSSNERQLPRLLNMLGTILKAKKHYALAQIDVFSGRAFIYAELSALLLNILKKPVVLTLHGGRLPEFGTQNPVRVRRLLQMAQVVVTPSPFIQKNLEVFRQDIRFIPNPIELSDAVYRQRTFAAPSLVWVRSFHSIYNPSLPIRALKELVDDFPTIRLTMIGPDKGDGSLQQLLAKADDLGVHDHLDLMPGVSHAEIPRFLDRGDVFINSSNYDNAPRSLIEAMGNGLCIVSTNVGGVPWLVEDEVEALLVPPDDPHAMASAIRRILNEPGLAARLSASARKKSLTYDWTSILPQWESLFMEVIAGQHG